MNKGAYILLICLMALGICSCGSSQEKKRILLIHSYENSYASYPAFNKLMTREFRKRGIDAEISTLYLDCESYLEEAELQRMRFLLDSMQSWKPEIILVNEDQATYSLLKCGHPLVKELPVVFSGVNYPNWDLIKQYPNVTGFHDRMDIRANLKMARRLFGSKINMFSLLDNTYLDKKIRTDIQEQLKSEKILCTSPLKRKALQELTKKGYSIFTVIPVRDPDERGDGALMWFLSKYSKGRCYLQVKRDFTTVNVSNITSSPCLTAINEAFGFGEKLLGGYFTTIPTQVKEQVDAANRILNGANPSDLPIEVSAKEYMMDWKVMEQLNIPLNGIPKEYTIINIPFREKHFVIWVALISLSTLLILSLIFRLVFLYRREQARKKKALYDLADEKETLALAVEGGTSYVWKMESNHIIFENAFWQSLHKDFKKLSIDDLVKCVHPDQREMFFRNWEKMSEAQKEIVQVQCDFDQKGYQWWEFRYTTTQLSSGEFRTAGLLLNIQAFKEREEELEKARKLAEKAELKESFLANMSHEIRTPLNAIVGFSTLLASDEPLDNEEKQDYITNINHNNELLLKLINDILELSRISSGYLSFTIRKYRVADLLNNIYNSHQMLMPSHIEFIKEYEGIENIEIDTDKERLAQVVTNFLNNACKFTKQGYIKLSCRYDVGKEEVRIEVEDTGRGIEPDEQKMIFTRFYKHDEFSQGTGLGLAICQSIVEKLRGRIELWSQPGKGSRFTVILPCAVVEGESAGIQTGMTASQEATF